MRVLRVRSNRLYVVVTSLALSTCLGLTACSSSGAADATPKTKSQSSGSQNAQAATAQKFVNNFLATPTKIGATGQLASAPPKGKTIVFTQGNTPQFQTEGNGVAAAAAALGWTLKRIPYDATNPATLVSAMQQALRYNPVAVVVPGLPESLWQSEIPAYEKARVPIVPMLIPVTTASRILLPTVGLDGKVSGKILGNWFIADSHADGKGLVLDTPNFPSVKLIADTISSTVAAGCSHCSLTTLNLTVAQQVGNQIVPAVISALRRDPSIQYVISADGVFLTGFTAAASSAGLSNLKLSGAFATAENESGLLNGVPGAFTTFNWGYLGWISVDEVLRHLAGMPIPNGDGGVPEQLVTKATAGTPSNTATAPANYPEQFKKLWKVG